MHIRKYQLALRLIEMVEKIITTPDDAAEQAEPAPAPAAPVGEGESPYVPPHVDNALTAAIQRFVGVMPDDPPAPTLKQPAPPNHSPADEGVIE